MDYPRLHFIGRYLANVNTVNNDPLNYKLSLPPDKLSQGWNPSGGNEWSLLECSITSVVYLNGTRTMNANVEPLIGAPVVTNPYSVEGKLVSFDVDTWNKSALFGVTLGVKQSAISHEFGFVGSWLPNSVIHQNVWYQIPCNDSYSDKHDVHGARSASKLTNIKWARRLDSNILQQLKQVSSRSGGQLSISITLYDFSLDSSAGNFSYGRISGTIGFAHTSEPRFFEGDRLLSFEFVDQPRLSLPEDDPCSEKQQPFWAYRAPFKVHSHTKILTVDFSSSFTRSVHGCIRDIGDLYLAILYSINGHHQCVDTIGAIKYRDDSCRKLNGCIMDYPLNDFQFYLVKTHPVVVVRPLLEVNSTVTTYSHCAAPVSHDSIHGMLTDNVCSMIAIMLERRYYIRPYNYYTFMMEKGGIVVVDLLVTSLGQPAYGKTIQMTSSPWIQPTDGVSYNHEAIVDQTGYARFVFHANSIKKNPRQELDLDGQVYLFMYHIKGEPWICSGDIKDTMEDQNGYVTCVEMITIKVFSDISYDSYTKVYTWVDHVSPIFLQYARLYPMMKKIVNLGKYEDVTQPQVLRLLNFSMQLDLSHPNHMPVSRDLSSSKRKMILEWLTKPCYNSTHCLVSSTDIDQRNRHSNNSLNQYVHKSAHTDCNLISSFHHQPHDFNKYYKFTTKYNANTQSGTNCIKELKQSRCFIHTIQYCLQKAFELEFYTIPLYLTALYSIKDGYNYEAYNIIRSVVMQEMLHMLQAANILISIGGRPSINSAASAPAYPATGLPGGVLPQLTVSLKKASLEHIHSIFMAIEYPHRIVDAQLGIDAVNTHTIGQLYAEIRNCLYFHGDSIFYPNHTSLQVKWPYTNDYGHVYIVQDLASAMEAIEEIIEQGEGMQPGDPHSYARNDLAHFFKFQEIVCGKELVFHGISNYSYIGPPIPFDDSGVWPMRDDPSSRDLTPGTKAYHQTKTFHQTYRSLLRTLDITFAGDPVGILETLAIMESLEVQAKTLMALPLNESNPHGETCGPVFDYEWSN